MTAESAESCHVIPCNGDVTIPLCARLRSVPLFRFSLIGVGGYRLIAGIG